MFFLLFSTNMRKHRKSRHITASTPSIKQHQNKHKIFICLLIYYSIILIFVELKIIKYIVKNLIAIFFIQFSCQIITIIIISLRICLLIYYSIILIFVELKIIKYIVKNLIAIFFIQFSCQIITIIIISLRNYDNIHYTFI